MAKDTREAAAGAAQHDQARAEGKGLRGRRQRVKEEAKESGLRGGGKGKGVKGEKQRGGG